MWNLMEASAIVMVGGETQLSFWFVKTFTDSQKRLVGLHCKDVYVPHSFTIFIPFTWITLFHAKPIGAAKEPVDCMHWTALRLLAVKTFFVQHSNFFGRHSPFFQAELIAVYCFGQLQPVYKNNALLWSFDGKFYNVIIELSVSFNFLMHKYTFILIEREKWQKPFPS